MISCYLLQFEADRRAIIITINSFGTELSKDDRAKLYPRCGKLNPDGLAALARADDYEQVKAVAEYYAEYSALFEGAGNNVGDKTLEDKFFEHEASYFFKIKVVYFILQLFNNQSRMIIFKIRIIIKIII